jgi:hypothetical protein
MTYEEAYKIQTTYDDPHGWIQWKGTEVCMDFYCVCGYHSHIDAYFTYVIQCPDCGKMFMMNGNIQAIEIDTTDGYSVVIGEHDDMDEDEVREHLRDQKIKHILI